MGLCPLWQLVRLPAGVAVILAVACGMAIHRHEPAGRTLCIDRTMPRRSSCLVAHQLELLALIPALSENLSVCWIPEVAQAFVQIVEGKLGKFMFAICLSVTDHECRRNQPLPAPGATAPTAPKSSPGHAPSGEAGRSWLTPGDIRRCQQSGRQPPDRAKHAPWFWR